PDATPARGHPSGRWGWRTTGVEKAMQVDDEIAQMRVIHGALRHLFPGRVGLRVTRIHADDIEFAQIGKFDIIEGLELTPEHQVQKLLGRSARGLAGGHDRSLPFGTKPPCQLRSVTQRSIYPLT